MLKSITLMVAIATLGYFSGAIWAKPVTSTTTSKDPQCSQSVCTKKCDAKNEKCSISCDDKAASNTCGKNSKHVTPFGVLEVIPKRGSP
jgi:hypothetical protein